MPIPKLSIAGQQIPAVQPTLSGRNVPAHQPRQNRSKPAQNAPASRSNHGPAHPGPLSLIFLRYNWAAEQLARSGHPEFQAKPWLYSLEEVEQMARAKVKF